jgi:cobalamin biosynthesis Mg chelatase CobN
VSPDNGEGAAVLGQASDSDRELLAGVLTQVEAWLAAGDAAEHQQQQEEEETEQQQQQQAMNGSTSKEGPSQHNGTPAEVNGSQQQAAPSTQGAAAAGAGAGLSSPGNSSRLQQQQGGHQELLLPPMTSWQRLLVYHQLATAPWVADRGGHSGVWVSKVGDTAVCGGPRWVTHRCVGVQGG